MRSKTQKVGGGQPAGKPGTVFRLGITWEAADWDALEDARQRYNAETGHSLTMTDFIRYVVKRFLTALAA